MRAIQPFICFTTYNHVDNLTNRMNGNATATGNPNIHLFHRMRRFAVPMPDVPLDLVALDRIPVDIYRSKTGSGYV